MLLALAGKVAAWFAPFGLSEPFVHWSTGGEKLFTIDQIYDPFADRICRRLIIELPGRGCVWYKASGGCTMCGFNRRLEEVNTKWDFSAGDLVGLYRMAEFLSRHSKPEWLSIYNGGSFFNPTEIPVETQRFICHAVRRHPTFLGLFVESRPEFIQKETIVPFKEGLGSKLLEVGIGLEAVSDRIREVNIHKGFSLRAYERAVELLKTNGVRVLTYVFLKPLGVSEKEAIEEAIKTIRYALSIGSDEISLSCAFVQKGTLMESEYRKNQFRPPWLWSILKVIRLTSQLGPIRIGSFEDEPAPIAIPFNCGKCDADVVEVINRYNLSRDISPFAEAKCECQIRWRDEIK